MRMVRSEVEKSFRSGALVRGVGRLAGVAGVEEFGGQLVRLIVSCSKRKGKQKD